MITLLLRAFILNVTLMVTHMYSFIISMISVEAQLPFVIQSRQCGSHMDVRSCALLPMEGRIYLLGKSIRPQGVAST